MRRKVDKMLSEQSFPASELDKKDLYGKFRILGANVDRLKRLGLAVPELQQLLKRLESVDDSFLILIRKNTKALAIIGLMLASTVIINYLGSHVDPLTTI